MSSNESRKMRKNEYPGMALKIFFSLLLVIAIIFIPAGRIDYWQGWLYSGITALCVLISAIVFASRMDLVRERQKPGPGTKWWDKIFWAFYGPTFFAIAIVASLDAGRFGWTPHLPVAVYIISGMVFVLSIFTYSWAMWVNRFFSSVVRIQKDRGQEVVQNGPYHFVRHPGYVGGILMAISTSLVLGSLWALIPAGVIFILLVIRTYLEDTTLQKELTGYADYAKKVRFRLLPGIW